MGNLRITHSCFTAALCCALVVCAGADTLSLIVQALQPNKCPHCGAPAQIPPGQMMYTCPYCHQQFQNPAAMQMQQQPQQQQGPTFIIVHGPGHDDDDDDDDDDHFDHFHHHHNNIAAAVVRTNAVSWLIWVIVSVVIALVAGGGAFFAWFSKHSSMASSLVWDGSAPFHCGGNDHISVKGVTASFNAGTAITVAGNCQFTCTDCQIKSQNVIEVSGNGGVTIINGSVIATDTLVDASSNARVNISGNVTTAGAVRKSGNAKVSAPVTPIATVPLGGTAVPTAAAASTPPAVGGAAPKTTPAKTVPKKK